MAAAEIGVLGGSGLYDFPGLEGVEEVRLDTPFGPPSDTYRLGTLGGRRVAFLARHGRGHHLSPSAINYRANLFGFKLLGVSRVLSASAVGSLSEAIAPLDVVVPDQFIDRTRHRADTFFEDGIVAHVGLADPVCPELTGALAGAASDLPIRLHRGGVYVCIEGPQFSTRAESHLYRSWGASVIGMTNVQEARLAREAELCYATLALVTDYDCWREGESVEVAAILAILARNAAHATALLGNCIRSLPAGRSCDCGAALRDAILTPLDRVPAATRDRLRPLLDGRP